MLIELAVDNVVNRYDHFCNATVRKQQEEDKVELEPAKMQEYFLKKLEQAMMESFSGNGPQTWYPYKDEPAMKSFYAILHKMIGTIYPAYEEAAENNKQ